MVREGGLSGEWGSLVVVQHMYPIAGTLIGQVGSVAILIEDDGSFDGALKRLADEGAASWELKVSDRDPSAARVRAHWIVNLRCISPLVVLAPPPKKAVPHRADTVEEELDRFIGSAVWVYSVLHGGILQGTLEGHADHDGELFLYVGIGKGRRAVVSWSSVSAVALNPQTVGADDDEDGAAPVPSPLNPPDDRGSESVRIPVGAVTGRR